MRVFERSVHKEAALIGLMFDQMYQLADSLLDSPMLATVLLAG